MAQQGNGHSGWPMDYDDGTGYGLPPAGDDLNDFLNMNALQHHPLETWSSVPDPSGTVTDGGVPQTFGRDPHHAFQQLPNDYANLVGAQQHPQHQQPTQQQWSTPDFAIQHQQQPQQQQQQQQQQHAFDPSSQNHGFVGHTPVSYDAVQGFAGPTEATGNMPTYLSGQISNEQWQQRQQQELLRQQQAALQKQRQQQQQQQLPVDVNRYPYATSPPVPTGPNAVPRPSVSPAPARQSTLTPDTIGHPHGTNSPAPGSGYQSPAQNWPGQAQLQQQQPQQHHLQFAQNMTPVPQPIQQQQQQQLHLPAQQQATPSPAPSTAATKATKAATTTAPKATKVTKPKATKATKAKAASQQAQPAVQQQAQPEHLYQQQMYLEPQQQQQPPPSHLPQQMPQQGPLEAGANGWAQHQQQQQQPGQVPYQQLAGEQAWQDQQQQQQQFMQQQQAQRTQQSPPQQGQQLRVQQYQPAQQTQNSQQQQQQLEQQRQFQQMQMQQQQLRIQQQQQQQMQQAQTRIPPPIISPIQPPTYPQSAKPVAAAKTTVKAQSSTPAQSTSAIPVPTIPTATPVPVPTIPGAAPASSRVKPAKAVYKKPQLSDVLPKEITHIVSAAAIQERKQLFPGVPFLVLGNVVDIEPPLSTTEPAVLPDPSKDLGTKHFPGRKGPLPCETIAEYDRLVSSQPSEKKEALVLELRSRLKSQGKVLPPKVYKFASLGDTPKKPTKSIAQGRPAAMESPGSNEESESDEEEEVRSATRPTDEADAAAWDAIGFVHVADNAPTTIKRAVKNFGDFIKGIYDGIKETKERLKKAEEGGSKNETVEQIKKTLASKQEILYRAVDAADEKGHDQVLENLGGNGPLVANLVSALRDCVNASDFNGKLTKTLLRFMSQFTTVTDEMLNQRLKFDKIQKRFMTKGDAEVKDLVGEIVSKTIHAKPASAKAAVNTATSASDTIVVADDVPSNTTTKPASSTSKTGPSRVVSDSSSSKRPREDESADSRPAKKSATNSASGAPQAVAKATPSSGAASSTPTAAKPWAGASLLPGKIRPAITKPAAAKADASSTAADSKADVFSKDPAKTSLGGSPSKRDADAPTTTGLASKIASSSTAANNSASTIAAAAAASRAKKAAAVAKAEQASSGSSKLGLLLDEISKPKIKSASPAAPTPDSSSSDSASASETPEQKAKRLRKESRRKLRVTWRTGTDLTQVRIFTKDEGEDEGRAKYLLRDAGDDRSEGLALKRRLMRGGAEDDDDGNGGGDDMNLDDDEDDELPYRPWFEASPLNFSSLPADKAAKTYVTRGGQLPVDSSERKAMADRENTVLMAIYTDPSDIPPTPKSPSAAHADLASHPVNGIAFPASESKALQEVQVRWNEERQYGANWAAWNAIQRLESAKNPQHQRQQPQHPQSVGGAKLGGTITSFTGARGGDVVRLLTSGAVRNWRPTLDLSSATKVHRWQDYSDPTVQKTVLALESIFLQLQGKTFPATEPPAYITDPERIKEWWTGYNREKQRERTQAEAAEAQSRNAVHKQPHEQQAHQPQAATTAAGQQQDATAAWAIYYAQQQQPAAAAQSTDANAYVQYMTAYYQQQAQQQQPQQQQQQAPQGSAGDPNAQLQALLTTLGGGSAAPPTSADRQNDAQLQALLASMMGGAGAGAGAGSAQPAAGSADANQAYLLSLAQWVSGGQQQDHGGAGNSHHNESQTDQDGGDSYKRSRGVRGSTVRRRNYNYKDSDGGNDSGSGNTDSNASTGPYNKRDRDSDSNMPNHLRGINRALIGTKACVFWASGKCAKGDKCTFRHD